MDSMAINQGFPSIYKYGSSEMAINQIPLLRLTCPHEVLDWKVQEIYCINYCKHSV
uniref:Uncharacterized protein n=1 Tax=Rhizophora mucronata TaxID=61149 RepID=A0A2P2R430_RHIMU